jgi:hypothetical protein
LLLGTEEGSKDSKRLPVFNLRFANIMLILEYLALLAVPFLIFSLISWSGMNGSIKRAARNIGDVLKSSH